MSLDFPDRPLDGSWIDLGIRQVLHDQERGAAIGNKAGRHAAIRPASLACLAVGYHLRSQNRDFVILDANGRVGDSWRKRWPSLRLYSPARFDGLPGMAFPAPTGSHPTGLEMADYLESYARRFELPVRSGITVDALERNGAGFVVTAGDRRLDADNVVVATGVFQHEHPIVPEFASELDPAAADFIEANHAALRPLFDVAIWPEFEKLVQEYAFADAQAHLEHALESFPAR